MLSLSQYRQYKDGADPANFITSQCLHPQKIRLVDSIGVSQEMYVPCGRCLRCSDFQRDQWVSRMCLHSLSYKHCYFVTLTYGTYDLNKYKSHPFKEDWLQTIPRYTNKNYNGRDGYAPVLLRQEHLTKFLKRLRKRLGFQITYCACGEYGEKYLRPHFHLIIWSNEVITLNDIQLAWSYDCLQLSPTKVVRFAGAEKNGCPHYSFMIGRVDFHDLVANGSLDFDAKQNQSNTNSRHVFSYVAKYVAKRHSLNARMRGHILSAFYHFDHYNLSDDPDETAAVMQSYINEENRAKFFGFDPVKQNTLLSPMLDANGGICITLKHNSKHYEKVSKDDFVQIFAPFFVSSRATAIGRPYYEKNYQRFSEGCFDLPQFHNKVLSFPLYFQRLLKNEKCPVYFRKNSLVCTSYSREFIPRVLRFYRDFREDSSIFYANLCNIFSTTAETHKMHKDVYLRPTLIDNDGFTTYVYSPNSDFFEGYRYSRKTRRYELCDVCDRISFCDYIINKLVDKTKSLTDEQQEHSLLCKFQTELLNLPQREEIVERFVARRNEKQTNYIIQQYQFSKL